MLTFIFAHLVVGLLLGTWFRFGVLFLAFFAVILEAVIAAQLGTMIPPYFLIIAGIVALQLGYVGGFTLKAHSRRVPTDSALASAGKPSRLA